MIDVVVTAPLWISNEYHLHFAEQFVASCGDHKVLLYPNRCFPDEAGKLFARIGEWEDANQDLSVAAAWNRLIKRGLTMAEFVIVANADIIFAPGAIDALVLFARAHPEFVLWTGAEWEDMFTLADIPAKDRVTFDEHPHFSAFMVSQTTIDKIGWFDEGFERAYCEDLDMHRRILLLGERAAKTASSRFYHFGSRTIACDEELKRRALQSQAKNYAYFERKHGYNPDGEAARTDIGYAHPFNDAERSWRE